MIAARTTATATLAPLRERIRQIEAPVRHGVLPFGAPAIDRALPGGGLALGAVHEILGQGGDEEDGAAAAGFMAGIVARLRGSASPAQVDGHSGGRAQRGSPEPINPTVAKHALRPVGPGQVSVFLGSG